MGKLIFIDTETTGTDRRKHEIIQLAAIVTDETGDTILDELNINIRPENVEDIDDEALVVCNKTLDDVLSNEYSREEGHQRFCEFLSNHINKYDPSDKAQFVAYNSTFDEDFVRKLFLQCNDNFYGSWFWNPSLCAMKEFAFLIRDNRHKLENMKLGTVCRFLDIDFNDDDGAHDALYDVKKTIELFKKLT